MVHIRVRDEQAASAKWCPKKDQAGNDLQDSRFPKAFAVTCTYKTGVRTGRDLPVLATSPTSQRLPVAPPLLLHRRPLAHRRWPQPLAALSLTIPRPRSPGSLVLPPSASPSTAHPDAVVSQNATPSPAGNAALSGKQKAPIGAIIGGILGPLFLLLLLAAGLLWWRRKQRKQESEWRRYPPPAPSFHTYTYTGTESDFIRSHSELLHSHASAVENLPGPPPSYASHPASARPGRVRSASTYSYPFAGDWREDANNLKRAATTREKERELQFVYE
ncbi:hypothetical protein MIND_00573700 [Mycena indigotica]|uniref:Uncharacterized protein n=1 Tax=Mycena indigotica TaxID=2126181 RepID=A0A8H6W2R4_9AGAR|nr:uncharacterized protein MIND_00573700 [Mycena indigotica]KAF7303449.1 hypothetical protein MIND_00573700 [Mycena indigotica]